MSKRKKEPLSLLNEYVEKIKGSRLVNRCRKKFEADFLPKYYSDSIYLTEWIVIGVIWLFLFLSFSYTDMKSLTVWSLNFWDVSFSGRFWEFYEYTAQNLQHLTHQYMGGDVITILPLSIWNLPIWLVQHFASVNAADNFFMLAWSHLGIMICLVLTAVMAYKICHMLTESRHQSLWAAVLTLSSAPALINVGIAGQSDIFLVLLGTLSIYYLMRNRTLLSVLFAACSIVFKPFFAFAFIPVVLLVEKNVFKAALKILCSLSIMLLSHFILSFMPMYSESIAQGPTMLVLNNLFSPGVATSQGQSSFFMAALIALCFIAYTTKPVDEGERNRYILYIASAVFVSILCLSGTEFYRGLVIMPYAAILVMSDKSKLRLNLLLLFIFQAFFTLGLTTTNAMLYSHVYMEKTLFGTIFPYANFEPHTYGTSIDVFRVMDSNLSNFLRCTFSAVINMSAALLLFINYPRLKWKSDLEKGGSFEKYDHGLLCLNILSIIPCIICILLIYFS